MIRYVNNILKILMNKFNRTRTMTDKTMTDKLDIDESTENPRRNLLKALAGTGAAATLAPEQWTKPVLNTILLPAHAQTTSDQEFGGGINNGLGANSRHEHLLDRFIQPAFAASSPVGENFGGGCVLFSTTGSLINILVQQTTGDIGEGSTTIVDGSFSTQMGSALVSGEISYNSAGAIERIVGDVDGHGYEATEGGASECPEESLQGVNANCDYNLGDNFGWGDSFSLCFSTTILNSDCAGATTMSYDVISGGTVIGHCGPNPVMNENHASEDQDPCFSCTLTSYGVLAGTADPGEDFTLDVTFDNGCRCSFVYATFPNPT